LAVSFVPLCLCGKSKRCSLGYEPRRRTRRKEENLVFGRKGRRLEVEVRKPAKCFEDLVVWQKAPGFVLQVYAATRTFPKEEIKIIDFLDAYP
jgi:hypothetical protein